MGWASIDGLPRTPVTGPGTGRDSLYQVIENTKVHFLSVVCVSMLEWYGLSYIGEKNIPIFVQILVDR